MLSPKALYDARPSIRQLPEWWRGKKTMSEVLPGLFMGGFPRGRLLERLAEVKIDHILAATFERPAVTGVTITQAPFYDIDLPRDLRPQIAAAREATALYRAGRRVYVGCGHGHDRSGLLIGLILHELWPDHSGAELVRFIRERRGRTALHNRRFARFVAELPGSLAAYAEPAGDLAAAA